MPFKNKEDRTKYNREYATKLRRKNGIKEKILMPLEQQKAHQKIASRKHYNSNLIQERERTKKWRKNNPEKQRFIEKRRRSRKANAEGSHTLQEWILLKREYGNMCVYCQKPETAKEKLTQDHILSLNKGGSDYIQNMQSLCFSCNASKQDKIINRIETDLMRFENV